MRRNPRPRPFIKTDALQRITIGRTIALISAAMFATARGLAYTPQVDSVLTPAVRLLSMNGELLWVWAFVWLFAASLCFVDVIRGTTRYGLSLVAALIALWGLTYLGTWILTGAGQDGWLTGFTLLGGAGIILGLLYKITALRDILETLMDTSRGRHE